MVKNCDLGLENAALRQYFQDLGHSFSPYGPPSRQITYVYFDNTVLCFDNIVLCYDNTVLCFDNIVLCYDNTVLCFDNSLSVIR